jgi:hypothetical protein
VQWAEGGGVRAQCVVWFCGKVPEDSFEPLWPGVTNVTGQLVLLYCRRVECPKVLNRKSLHISRF